MLLGKQKNRCQLKIPLGAKLRFFHIVVVGHPAVDRLLAVVGTELAVEVVLKGYTDQLRHRVLGLLGQGFYI